MGHRRRHYGFLAALIALVSALWILGVAGLTPETSIGQLAAVFVSNTAAVAFAFLAAAKDRALDLLRFSLPGFALSLGVLPDEAHAWALTGFGLLVSLALLVALCLLGLVWARAESLAVRVDGVQIEDLARAPGSVPAPLAEPRWFRSLRAGLLLAHFAVGPVIAIARQSGSDDPGHPFLALLLPLLFASVVIPPAAFLATPPDVDARLQLRALRHASRPWIRLRSLASVLFATTLLVLWARRTGLW